jgi:hypothetical protein
LTSKITALRDALKTLVETTLTGYRQIPNPYETEKTANVILKKGYGLAFGPASNTERLLSCQLSVEREIVLVLTRQVSSTEHDTDRREDIEQAILEDQFLVIQALEADSSLGGNVSRAAFLSDNGLEYVAIENSRYFVLQSSFVFEYFEDLTP